MLFRSHDWWEKAEPLTELQAAERTLGDWYISIEHASDRRITSYRVSTPTLATNTKRMSDLRIAIQRQRLDREDISPKVRLLMHCDATPAAWLNAEFLFADRSTTNRTRVLWRKNKDRWSLVSDGRVHINEHAMALLRPKAASITEGAD